MRKGKEKDVPHLRRGQTPRRWKSRRACPEQREGTGERVLRYLAFVFAVARTRQVQVGTVSAVLTVML